MWRFLKKLGIELAYNPAIPLLGIHPKEIRIERKFGKVILKQVLFPLGYLRKLLASVYLRIPSSPVNSERGLYGGPPLGLG